MSWLLNLYQTYESNMRRVGVIEKKHNDQEYTLLPVSHTTQTAHIQVNVTEDGNYHSAFIITDKSDASTLIPCTEDSSSRAGSKVAPYPLHDKISYVAGDYIAYGGAVKEEDPFTAYINQLQDWADSPYAHPKVKSIFAYLNKRQLIQDLVNGKLLALDADNKLIGKWDKQYSSLYEDKPTIFSIVSGEQESAFIRFNVHSSTNWVDIWNDKEMYASFVQFYSNKLGEEKLCYVTGDLLPGTDKHANKIRNAADKAKLISANDTSGFTFRGRFNVSHEVAGISYDVSQKAHNALKWLIHRQGKFIDQRVFLVWANDKEVEILDLDDPCTMEDIVELTSDGKSFTNAEYAREVAKALDGYRNTLSSPNKSDVSILVLDSATTGRMAVLYYRNMNKELYIDKLIKWHSTCVWRHRYRKDQNGQYIEFIGAPTTKDIAYAAYGPKANEKVVKGLMERMLPCVVDERTIPLDIIKSAFYRASNPVATEKWEWEKTLSITCALINKSLIDKQEGYEVALDKGNDNRDYLFGRLLAVADVLERRALGADENRASNAIRYMNSFAKHPARTWKTIQASLQPYQARLGAKGYYYSGLIDEIASMLKYEDFNNKPLSGKYLLGFYSQRHELYQKKAKEDNTINLSNSEEI
ncbi:type I-C CRISPR-associated protein Cas8c/Csd1 [Paenibacillus assamensis]|uniref:type I-C CRISPR-associated protein Cas8c/Csd1 n=1 Tax=Paenibacillus assamensis TaxID=311244 RepID=UPI0003F70B6A|nr:type I-C CRISPR-associated protein Cas8c/Csd1 [Paenibacillus assamensis]